MTATKRRPLFLACGHPHGGILNTVAALFNELKRRGEREIVVYGPKTLVKRLNPADLGAYRPFQAVERSWGINQWKFALLTSLRSLSFRWFRGGILHANHPTLLAPDVYSAHGFYTRSWLGKPRTGWKAKLQFLLLSTVEKRALRRAKRVVYASREAARYVEEDLGIHRDKAAVWFIPPGIDTTVFAPRDSSKLGEERRRAFPGVAPDARWLLFVGNDFNGKGFLRIVQALIDRDPNDRSFQLLAFCRDPENEPQARALAEKLPGRVHFFQGGDGTVPTAYRLSEVLVMDSVSEGFPLVLLEAMASGCVPVVTGFGGSHECVGDGKAGFLVRDARNVVRAALETPAEILAMLSKEAQERALTFSWARNAEQHEKVYATLD